MVVARKCRLDCGSDQASRTSTGGNSASLNRDLMNFWAGRSACGFQDKGDQVDTVVPTELFLLFGGRWLPK